MSRHRGRLFKQTNKNTKFNIKIILNLIQNPTSEPLVIGILLHWFDYFSLEQMT